MQHFSGVQGITMKIPAETLAAILLMASGGFAEAARIDTDAEELFAKFLDLFLPAVMEQPRTGSSVRPCVSTTWSSRSPAAP